MENHEIALKLGRSVRSIHMKAYSLGLAKPNASWSPEELGFLSDHYLDLSLFEISQKLERKPRTVRWMASKLGLTRNSARPYELAASKWGYLSGLIDGEGLVTVAKQKGGIVRIGMTHAESIDQALNWMRRVGYHPNRRVLKANGVERKQDMHYVELGRAEEIVSFLENLPHLCAKRSVADLVREFCSLRLEANYSSWTSREEDLQSRVRRLNMLSKGRTENSA